MIWYAIGAAMVVAAGAALLSSSIRSGIRAGLFTLAIGLVIVFGLIYSGIMGG